MASAEREGADIDSGQLTDQQFERVIEEIAPLSIVRQIINYRERLRNDRPQRVNQLSRPFFSWVGGFRRRSHFPAT